MGLCFPTNSSAIVVAIRPGTIFFCIYKMPRWFISHSYDNNSPNFVSFLDFASCRRRRVNFPLSGARVRLKEIYETSSINKQTKHTSFNFFVNFIKRFASDSVFTTYRPPINLMSQLFLQPRVAHVSTLRAQYKNPKRFKTVCSSRF